MNGKAVTTRKSSSIEAINTELATYPNRRQVAEVIGVIVAGCARSGELTEEEAAIRLTLIDGLMSRYPTFVLAAMADPYSGIVTKHKFLPAVAEVKEFAEAILREKVNKLRQARQRREREEEAKRERQWAQAQPPAEERARAAAAVMQRCGFAKRAPGPLPKATPEEIREWQQGDEL